MQKQTRIQRGDVWYINFDPQVGDEIRKIRPAVVMSSISKYPRQLKIVVPITSLDTKYEEIFWMITIPRSEQNGLSHPSMADASQVKSLSKKRFKDKIGRLTNTQMGEIAAAVAFCIGYQPPRKP